MESTEPTFETPAPETGEISAFPAAETPALESPVEEKTNWKQFLFDLVETLALAVILYFGINALSARVRVDGFSMNPTLQDGEYVLVSRVTYKLGDPQHGDIIVFEHPNQPQEDLIKRIVGLPGDTVEVTGMMVYVNGQALDEPYINAAPLYSGKWEVPEGYLFVLGDNRNESSDSHAWGLLPMENVVGKALVIYWPPPDWNIISHYDIAVAAPQ
jgi:signal peptidase I